MPPITDMPSVDFVKLVVNPKKRKIESAIS